MAVGIFRYSAFSMDRLTKRFIFSFPDAGRPGESPLPCRKFQSRKVKKMKKILTMLLALAMLASLAACGSAETQETTAPATTEISAVGGVEGPTSAEVETTIPGLEDGVFTVGMECAYAPYNWMQMTDENGAVPISNVPGSYANGYDVMIAQRICDAYGWELEIVSSAWDSLTPAVQSGTMDANIAGQSMTAERMAEVDMAGPYYYARPARWTLSAPICPPPWARPLRMKIW